MATLEEKLAAQAKELVVVWDFPDLATRFVSHEIAELATPGGWTLFVGAVPLQDAGSELDLVDGRLTIGGSAFEIPDVAGGITTWILANEEEIDGAKVVRLEGFVGVAESAWASTTWFLRDYGVAGRQGGGYRFELENILGLAEAPLFGDYTQEGAKLLADLLNSETTDFDLEEDPNARWDSGGTLLLWDTENERGELITYSSIVGTLVTITERNHLGVGADFSETFVQGETEVFRVWTRRGAPIAIALRLLLTDPSAKTNDAVALEQGFPDPGLDSLAWPLEADGPYTDGWKADEPTSSTVTREDGLALGGTAVRLSSGAGVSDDASLTCYAYDRAGFDSGGWWALSLHYLDGSGSGTLSVQIVSRVNGTGVIDQYWNDATQAWQAGTSSLTIVPGPSAAWQRLEMIFPGQDNDDRNIWVKVTCDRDSHATIVDSIQIRGRYDTEPASIWDDGSGEGLGLPPEIVDVAGMEEIQARDLRIPTFDSDGDLVTGTAVLFVELEEIENVREWLEDHILRPFGLWPAIDDQERLALRYYAASLDSPIAIGDSWMKGEFRASGWSRKLDRTVNYLQLSTDFSAALGSYGAVDTEQSPASVARHTRSKIKKIESRGGRTGLYGFPDYGSEAEIGSAAGRLFAELAGPNGDIEIATFYQWRGVGVGQEVSINVPLPDMINGVQAIAGGVFRVVRRQIDAARGRVILTLRQPLPVIRLSYVAPNTVASTYSAATTEDRTRAYIAPTAAGFSDGTPVYKVI